MTIEWSFIWSVSLSVVFFAAQLFLSARVLLRRAPLASAHAWLLVLWLLPLVGMGLYLLIGESRLGSLRRRKYTESERMLCEHAERFSIARERSWVNGYDRFEQLARLGTSLCQAPPIEGNHLSLHTDASETLDAMIADIDAAESHVHLLTYIFYPGGKAFEVVAALERAAARGVECRVAVDGAGSRPFFRFGLDERLRASGVEVCELLSVNVLRLLFRRLDLRNHRKVLVIDGRIGYCGSQNITDDTFRPKGEHGPGPWHDATVRLEGYAARALALVFLADWNSEAPTPIADPAPYLPPLEGQPSDEITSAVQILPSGPDGRPGAVQNAFVSAMYLAHRELIVTTPYFVPDATVRAALIAAAARGVEVTLIVPERNDAPIVDHAARANYHALLESGVRIMRYTPGLLHAKTISIDGMVALIGSANLDQRSFKINFECTLAVYDRALAGELSARQRAYAEASEPIDPEEWTQRSLASRLVDSTASLFSPLL